MQVYLLSDEFMKRGWKVEVVCLKTKDRNSITSSKYYNANIRYHYYRQTTIRALEFIHVFFVLLRTRSSYYYQRTDYSLTGATAFYCKLFRKKMIYALAANGDARRKKYSDLFDRSQYTSRLKAFIRRTDLKLVDRMVEYGKKNAHLVVCQNFYQEATIKAEFDLNPVIVRNSFKSARISSSDKENIILWVGNIRHVKNVELFLQLVEENKLDTWKFIVIGDANEEYLEKIKGIKKKNFEYLGQLNYEETNQWFGKSKVFINTSFEEGFSNTFIQSWVYRNLVLSWNVNPDKLISLYGYFFDGNYTDLKEKLIDVCENYNENLKMIDEAEQYALDNFDLSKNTDTLINLFRSLN